MNAKKNKTLVTSKNILPPTSNECWFKISLRSRICKSIPTAVTWQIRFSWYWQYRQTTNTTTIAVKKLTYFSRNVLKWSRYISPLQHCILWVASKYTLQQLSDTNKYACQALNSKRNLQNVMHRASVTASINGVLSRIRWTKGSDSLLYCLLFQLCVSHRIDTWQIVDWSTEKTCPTILIHKSEI